MAFTKEADERKDARLGSEAAKKPLEEGLRRGLYV